MTADQARRWEKLQRESLIAAAHEYAIASGRVDASTPDQHVPGATLDVLGAGARLRLAAKSYHEASVQRLLLVAEAESKVDT